jgi:hypothetical protein
VGVDHTGFAFLTRDLTPLLPPDFPFADVDENGHPGLGLFAALKNFLGGETS